MKNIKLFSIFILTILPTSLVMMISCNKEGCYDAKIY